MSNTAVSFSSESARLMQHVPEAGSPDRFFAREGVDPLTQAFAGKIAVHPGAGGQNVPEAERGRVLADLARQERDGASLAYIHVPFCETHCLYCGFFNRAYAREQSRPYVDTLIRELDLWRDLPVQAARPIHAVYLGGGTPTALEPDDLKRLLLAVRAALPLANDCEITVEGRVSNLDRARIEACLEGGANRFSLGVQSFQTAIRQRMGRRSRREDLIERLGLLQSYDQAAVIVDLIYGFPLQSLEDWLDDIALARELELDGLDCYQLNIYASSPLARAIEADKLPAGADIPAQAGMFAAAVHALEQAYYRRLSISHWGRTPRERNVYNRFMKGGAHCLAFGPGGGGMLHGHFYVNTPDYAAWQQAVAEGRKACAMMRDSGPDWRLFKAVTEQMEQGRLEIARLDKLVGRPLTPLLQPLLGQWERAGLGCPRATDWVLTLAGQFWQVNLTQLLLDYLNQTMKDS